MFPLTKALMSSVGKKFIMGITGLAFVIFLIEHLSANLLLFGQNAEPYNEYTHFLLGFGSLLIVAEVILIVFFLFHIYNGITIALGKKQARPENYVKTGKAGGASKKTFSSMTMIWTGLLTLVFVIIHLKTFKFGHFETVTIDGDEVPNFYKMVYQVFQNPVYVAWYVGALAFLGFHLRHGFWSAFQSLGIEHPRYSPIIYSVGILAAIVIAAGFIGIPVYIYFSHILTGA